MPVYHCPWSCGRCFRIGSEHLGACCLDIYHSRSLLACVDAAHVQTLKRACLRKALHVHLERQTQSSRDLTFTIARHCLSVEEVVKVKAHSTCFPHSRHVSCGACAPCPDAGGVTTSPTTAPTTSPTMAATNPDGSRQVPGATPSPSTSGAGQNANGAVRSGGESGAAGLIVAVVGVVLAVFA